METNRIENLKKQYQNIHIPEELDNTVQNAIQQAAAKPCKRRLRFLKPVAVALSVVMAFAILCNALPVTAYALQKIPVIGGIVRVITFGRFQTSDEKRAYEVNIEVPKIQGLSNENLQNELNEQYLEQSKTLYKDFMDKINAKDDKPVYAALDAGYSIQAQTGSLISIMNYVDDTQASCNETQQFVTIDTDKQVLITLPSLFKDKSYVQIITQNISKQMKEQMLSEPDEYYYFTGDDGFTKIKEDQQFYINTNHKLVIVFDKYTVAPGSMGVVEFTIPTEILTPILVSNEYIK